MDAPRQSGRNWSDSAKGHVQDRQDVGSGTAVFAAGVTQLAQASAVNVPMPDTLETVVVPTRPDTVYDLPDAAEGVLARQVDGNLLLAFPNGGMVEFSGFASASHGVEFRSPDKGILDAESFLRALQSNAEGLPAPLDNPNFSPGPSPKILTGLSPSGALAATEPHIPALAVQLHFAPPSESNSIARTDIEFSFPRQTVRLADVVTVDQLLSKLFHLPVEHHDQAVVIHDMLYTVIDTHPLPGSSVVNFHFIDE